MNASTRYQLPREDARAHDEESREGRMGFLEHLEELPQRLISRIAFAVEMAVRRAGASNWGRR
jgi:hypothetical protein